MKTHFTLITFLFIGFNLFGFQPVSINGIVRDSLSGEAISAANIVVANHSTGTISNFTGEFQLYLDKGNYSVSFSHEGYISKQMQISLNESQEIVVDLIPENKTERGFMNLFKKQNNETASQL